MSPVGNSREARGEERKTEKKVSYIPIILEQETAERKALIDKRGRESCIEI